LPLTDKVAVAVPPDPTSAADPIDVPLTEKCTVPVGVAPLAPTTVAIRNIESVTVTVRKLLMRVMLAAVGGGRVLVPPFHAVINL
jgi:hypothetical protein